MRTRPWAFTPAKPQAQPEQQPARKPAKTRPWAFQQAAAQEQTPEPTFACSQEEAEQYPLICRCCGRRFRMLRGEPAIHCDNCHDEYLAKERALARKLNQAARRYR